jgi:pyrrolidone-carboxylate peptidase
MKELKLYTGSFVCNAFHYHLMHMLHERYINVGYLVQRGFDNVTFGQESHLFIIRDAILGQIK